MRADAATASGRDSTGREHERRTGEEQKCYMDGTGAARNLAQVLEWWYRDKSVRRNTGSMKRRILRR